MADPQVSGIHHFKIAGSCASLEVKGGNLEFNYNSGKSFAVPDANVQLVATSKAEVMVFFHEPAQVLNRGAKPKSSVVAHFRQGTTTPIELSRMLNKTYNVIDIQDVPQVNLADGSLAFMHDDAVVWLTRDGSCHVACFDSTSVAVFQRLQGGSSTFDINFIGPMGIQTLEYIPHDVLANVLDYLPENVLAMTNGADPIRMQHAKSRLSDQTEDGIREIAKQLWTPLVLGDQSEDSGSEEGSEYMPGLDSEQSSSGSDDDDMVSCDGE